MKTAWIIPWHATNNPRRNIAFCSTLESWFQWIIAIYTSSCLNLPRQHHIHSIIPVDC
jgi:hypothetical protein